MEFVWRFDGEGCCQRRRRTSSQESEARMTDGRSKGFGSNL